jgi:predicted TIM-barrel fold metal-dependent hydrolase
VALEYFDCNCFIGRTAVPEPRPVDTAEALSSRMARYGIKRALVYHSVARDHSPVDGNLILTDELKGMREFEPVWIVMPHHTGEFPNPEKLLDGMMNNNVKAVRIYPSADKHNYSIKPYSAGPLFSMLESVKVPLFVDIDEIGWTNIDILLSEYPNLPVVLCNTGYRGDRYLHPLMATYGNLYIETSRFLSHLGIEALCGKFGADRILFGSGMPLYTGSGAVFYIDNLMIDENDRKLIASGNLDSLLSGVEI